MIEMYRMADPRLQRRDEAHMEDVRQAVCNDIPGAADDDCVAQAGKASTSASDVRGQ